MLQVLFRLKKRLIRIVFGYRDESNLRIDQILFIASSFWRKKINDGEKKMINWSIIDTELNVLWNNKWAIFTAIVLVI